MESSKSSRVHSKSSVKPTAEGFTMAEIVNRISRMYNINPNKGFRNQVATALRRGINFGILVKSRNKFRYDPEASLRNSMKRCSRQPRGQIRQGKRRASTKSRAKSARRSSRKKTLQQASLRPQKRTPPAVPRPTVPPPPSFEQKPRHLLNEPFAKVIKHPKMCEDNGMTRAAAENRRPQSPS